MEPQTTSNKLQVNKSYVLWDTSYELEIRATNSETWDMSYEQRYEIEIAHVAADDRTVWYLWCSMTVQFRSAMSVHWENLIVPADYQTPGLADDCLVKVLYRTIIIWCAREIPSSLYRACRLQVLWTQSASSIQLYGLLEPISLLQIKEHTTLLYIFFYVMYICIP
jgi:hypothetical protein